MKLIGSITMTTEKGEKAFASTQDLGDAPDSAVVQGALHQFVGAIVNSIAVHRGTFSAMSVTVEGE